MSNDPNDRFMISDLSSKLSAYINGEYSDQSLQTRDPADIEDVLATEIKPAESVRKLPGDELFTDLNQALDSQPDSSEENARKQKLAEEQRQRAEEARRQQLRNEQQRQQRIREEQQRQQRIREEQQRQLKIQEEQQRQLKIQEEQQRQLKIREEQQRQLKIREEQQRQLRLRREKALARSFAEGLYSFDLDQPFTSVRSGHSARYTKLSPTVRSMPSEEAIKKALAKTARDDRVLQPETSYEAPKAVSYEAPRAESSYEAPKAVSYEAPRAESSYETPKAVSYEASRAETTNDALREDMFFETPVSAAQASIDQSRHTSQHQGESRYAKSPDPSYRGYQEERNGSRIAVIIALLIALLAVAAIFIIIRKYSSNLTHLLTGTPAAGTTETASTAEANVESEAEESRAANTSDSSAAVESQSAVNMAINEEGEIFHADSETTEPEESGELIPEDPNDISYLASVNERAAADAIAELSDAAPRLYLSAYGIKISAGNSFNALSYVERIEDDADERDRLFRDISVDGLGEFDAKTPGTYELTYFCYDSAGNRSNRAKLTVIVE